MPIGSRASSDEATSAADVRRAQDLEVAPHAPRRARAPASSTASIIAGVSLPVNVFCWLGWKQPSSGHGSPSATDAVAELRLRARHRSPPSAARSRSALSHAKPPRQTHDVDVAQQRDLALQPVRAVRALLGRRQVRGRRAAHRGDHVRAAAARARRPRAIDSGLVGEPDPVQRRRTGSRPSGRR